MADQEGRIQTRCQLYDEFPIRVTSVWPSNRPAVAHGRRRFVTRRNKTVDSLGRQGITRWIAVTQSFIKFSLQRRRPLNWDTAYVW